MHTIPSQPETSLRHSFIVRFAVLALVLTWAGIAGCRPSAGPLELTILHTNDVHARFLPIDRFGTTCRDDAVPEQCFGGVAKRATVIERLRAERPNVLLLDAGDQFQGTLFYSKFKGEAAAAVMNRLGYDAMVVGNHEFDDGPGTLAAFVERVDFPVLGANVDATVDPALAGKLAPSTVVEVAERRIGIVGFITEETATLSRAGDTVRFLPIEDTIQPIVDQLERDGIDIIIGLSHAGFTRDRKLARAIAGLDVIVGGHTNTLLSNSAPGAEGPYPVVVDSPRGEPVLVITDFAWGKYLGRLDVRFDAHGVLETWEGDPILLDAQVVGDPEMAALLEPFAEQVEEFSHQVIGAAAVPLEGGERACRFGECNLGDLIADALLEHGREQGTEIALQNGGGIRSSIGQGPITVASVLEVMPFNNTASTFGLRGDDLLLALEHGVSQAEDPDNDGTGRFLQVAGLRYSFTLARPPGDRIRSVETREADGSWAPLDPDRVYRVICNDFNRHGGDGFEVLAERAIDPYDQGRVLSAIVMDHIAAHSPVSPRVDGRIREVP